MSKHTPGPWVYDEENADGDTYTIAHSPNYQAAIRSVSDPAVLVDIRRSDLADSRSLEEARANARLIAAAPELLAACQAYLDAEKLTNAAAYVRALSETKRLIAEAVAKATGS